MRMSSDEYAAFVDSLSPRSPIWGDLLRAGLVGGAICTLGQALTDLYTACGAAADTAAVWCSITLVFLGALLTGLGVYDDLARFAGAGSLVPITGFANAVVSPALEFKTEKAKIPRFGVAWIEWRKIMATTKRLTEMTKGAG